MACGCKKKKQPVAAAVPKAEPMLFSTNRDIGIQQVDAIVRARCLNCTGLLRTRTGVYLPMSTGEYYDVQFSDVLRWRVEGWMIEVT